MTPLTPVPALAAHTTRPAAGSHPPRFLARSDLQALIDALEADGRQVIGPTVTDGAIVLDAIHSTSELPAGWGAEAGPGRYRLVRRDDDRLFDYAVGPQSWKSRTFPSAAPLTSVHAGGGDATYEPAERAIPRLAFLGVRACEIAAIAVQDRVLLAGPYIDDDYRARRDAAFIVAVECASATSTCFCSSMGTGPEVRGGHDLVLQEVDGGFVAEAGSVRGQAFLDRLPTAPPSEEQLADALRAVGAARATMEQNLGVETVGLKERLLTRLDDKRWGEVAERCLMCTSCTAVCPTCFCTSVSQRSQLVGTASGSTRTWDSCLNPGFAHVVGGNFRSRPRDRYRQWLTHKFATWVDQFGTFGCVGCGRCIAWCPVGIDVREELAAVAPPISAEVAPPPPPTLAGTPQEFGTARVAATRAETHEIVTLTLTDLDPSLLATKPGQFVMLTLPAFPRLPISVSRVAKGVMELTIRAAGPATAALTRLKPGETLGIRGPLGRGWPIERAIGRDVIVVAGGIGLAPLRPLIDAIEAERSRFGRVRLFLGARTPGDLLFREEISRWMAAPEIEVGVTVDRSEPGWLGRVGIVTQLFDQAGWEGSRAAAFVCGPERMMQATTTVLFDHGLHGDNVFVTLERHMECGIGLCGHCQMGRFFVCKDGPVFSMAELGDTFGREGI